MAAKRSIVLELQRLAVDGATDVSTLLRKALLVATKLRLEEFRRWLNHELQGYPSDADVPRYRKCRAEIRLKNPYHGLIPVFFQNKRVEEALCEVEIRQSVGSLGEVLASRSADTNYLTLSLSHEQKMFLMEGPDGADLPPVRIVGAAQVGSVLDGARNAVLEWSLKLEEEGITGEGLTFSDEEKSKAAASAAIQIANFQGILGNVTGSTVSQSMGLRVTAGDFGSLRAYLESIGVGGDDVEELRLAIKDDPSPDSSQGFGDRVSVWLGKMVGRAASGAWQVGVGAAGNLLAAAIQAYYGF